METEGSYLLSWDSSTRWREEFSLPNFDQVRVGRQGGVWEMREPSYLSPRIWQLMQAMTFYGRLNLQREESADKIKLKNKNGAKLRCVEIRRDALTVRQLCFSADSARLVSEHYVPSDRTYEFSDYVGVGAKFIPGRILVYDGKALAAEFSVMNVEETITPGPGAYDIPAKAEWRVWCSSPEEGGDPLTPIYSRFVQRNGEATVFGAIGTDGLWHGVHILKSGGTRHDSEVLEALKREQWKPTSCNGVPIVIETVFKR
jgi:hypothetical protein